MGFFSLFAPWLILLLLFLPPVKRRVSSYLSKKPAFQEGHLIVGALMALTAVVAKADGHVSKNEVRLIRQFAARQFGLNPSALNQYEKAFNYGKNHPEEKDEYIRIIKHYHTRRDFILAVSYLLLLIVRKEGTISATENQLIEEIVEKLGLSPYEFQSLKQYMNQTFNHHSQGQTKPQFQESKEDKIKKYTKVLGVPKDADEKTIKQAYRKLAKEYHPDKVISKGMPKEYIDYANKHFSEINHAYDQLKDLVFD